MTQRILSLLLLGAISIGITTAVTHNVLNDAEHKLETEESIAGAKNKQILELKDALANYERAKLKPGKLNPVEVRIVK